MKKHHLLIGAVVTALLLVTGLAYAQGTGPEYETKTQAALGTAFTYQGQLSDENGLVDGTCDLTFELYDAAGSGTPPTGGTLLGTADKPGHDVTDGLFTVKLDFGSEAFDGDGRWLQVTVDCGDGAATLSPRQELTPAPYALALPGLRTEQNSTSPNVIGGYSGNSVTAGAVAATIGGGGQSDVPNRVTDHYGTVGGGIANQAGDNAGDATDAPFATVGGGGYNIASGWSATVGGGWYNTASVTGTTVAGGSNNIVSGWSATVGGGLGNIASNYYATIGGGRDNIASNDDATIGGGRDNIASGTVATVGGGEDNIASQDYATVGGGESNRASGSKYATVGGGGLNSASNTDATVGGGYWNTASGTWATVGGGRLNSASDRGATVGGGEANLASQDYATVGGGGGNTASGSDATVGGGGLNSASGSYATVGGGSENIVSGTVATVGGGEANFASQDYATVGGGKENTADGAQATVAGGADNTAGYRATVGGGLSNEAASYGAVPGGYLNSALGSYSFAAGRRGKANNQGCFVWGDSTDADVTCSNNNRTIFRSSGGFYIYTSSDLSTGMYLDDTLNQWQPIPAPSDRNLKQDIVAVDVDAVLEKVAALPLSTWSYKTSQDVRHMSPMAQDFYAAFGLGEDDRHLAALDTGGVALAAIQGLHARNEELEAENAELRSRVDDLERRLEAVERALNTDDGTEAASNDFRDPLKSTVLPGAGMLVVAVAVAWGARRKRGIR
jgi:hypothetical protein